jgi:hypothetical protein
LLSASPQNRLAPVICSVGWVPAVCVLQPVFFLNAVLLPVLPLLTRDCTAEQTGTIRTPVRRRTVFCHPAFARCQAVRVIIRTCLVFHSGILRQTEVLTGAVCCGCAGHTGAVCCGCAGHIGPVCCGCVGHTAPVSVLLSFPLCLRSVLKFVWQILNFCVML